MFGKFETNFFDISKNYQFLNSYMKNKPTEGYYISIVFMIDLDSYFSFCYQKPAKGIIKPLFR